MTRVLLAVAFVALLVSVCLYAIWRAGEWDVDA